MPEVRKTLESGSAQEPVDYKMALLSATEDVEFTLVKVGLFAVGTTVRASMALVGWMHLCCLAIRFLQAV